MIFFVFFSTSAVATADVVIILRRKYCTSAVDMTAEVGEFVKKFEKRAHVNLLKLLNFESSRQENFENIHVPHQRWVGPLICPVLSQNSGLTNATAVPFDR